MEVIFLDGLNGLLSGYYLIILITIILLTNSNNEIDIINYNFVITIIYTLFVFYFLIFLVKFIWETVVHIFYHY